MSCSILSCVDTTCEWVMSHMWMSHVTHVNESWHTHKCHAAYYLVLTLAHVSLLSLPLPRAFTRVTWLFHMCVMTHLFVCHDSFVCVPWFVHMCVMTHSCMCHDSFTCVTWLIHMCVMSHLYVWQDSFICVSWLIHMTHSYVCYDSFICVANVSTRTSTGVEFLFAWGIRTFLGKIHVTHMNE